MSNEYPAELGPILAAIADRAARLCESQDARIFVVEGDALRYVAGFGEVPFPMDPLRPLMRGLITGRAVIDRAVVHVEDMPAANEFPESQEFARRSGNRAALAVPLVRGDKVLGVILLRRRELRPFDQKHIEMVKAFADQAAVGIENLRLSTELKARNAELTEALEQQAATADILRVISGSPTDIQPALDAILESATRLCGAHMGILSLYDGRKLRRVAQRGANDTFAEWIRNNSEPYAPPGASVIGRMIAERKPVHVPDLRESAGYRDRVELSVAIVELGGARTLLAVPLLKEERVIGGMTIFRPEVRPFTQKQIELVTTFANQAVIAIENVRLFNETREALEQQKATTGILNVISHSPTEIQPVLDAVAATAARLCGADDVLIRQHGGDGLRLVAHVGSVPALPSRAISRGFVVGRAMIERRTIHVHDMLDERHREEYPDGVEMRGQLGIRTMLVAPLLREGVAIGAIAMRRRELRPFSDREINLLETFAAQAAIAIENVRLFNETKEALEQQTATAGILKVISSSPTDTQPVFDAIVKSCTRLFGGTNSTLRLIQGNRSQLVASTSPGYETAGLLSIPLVDDRLPAARAVLRREVVQVPDAFAEEWVSPQFKERAAQRGFRAIMVAPMLRESNVIGTINVSRAAPGSFSNKEAELLKTFADQAVIAIENVRLFKELQARNAEITESLEQQTATAEILKVISRSPTDVQPVFDAIVKSGAHLFRGSIVMLRLVKGNSVEQAARSDSPDDNSDVFRVPLDDERFVSPRAIIRREIVHVPDIFAEDWPSERMRQRAKRIGWRAILCAPMLRDDTAIGTIAVTRTAVGPFTEKEIALLKTFADQAVIAIENVRLFKELQARNSEISESLEQQTATAEVLREISRSPADLEPIYRTILESINRLCEANIAALFVYDGEVLSNAASYGTTPEFAEHIRASKPRPSRETTTRLAALERRVVQVADLLGDPSFAPEPRDLYERENVRTVLSVPMIREDKLVGVITVWRREVRSFTDRQVHLVKTFADQAVIAIENVRLFKEIQEKGRQLEIANKHKSEFLANMSHELRTPLNAVIGFSEALVEKMFGELNPKQEDYLRDIHSSGRHLLSLINDILDLSKIEAGRMELELSEFSLPMALKNALTLVRERAQTHGIEMKLHVDPKLGDICADERKFKQIVVNLLSNAVKFTPDGGRVEVEARRNGSSLKVSVKDTGIGIASKDQAALFEEFRQVGRGSTGKREGTGLGLALTRRFVELHGGKIGVDSAPGKGSTFTFTVPLISETGVQKRKARHEKRETKA